MLIKYWFSKRKPYRKKGSVKYFIGFNDNDVIRCIKLPQMIGYVKHFDSNKSNVF